MLDKILFHKHFNIDIEKKILAISIFSILFCSKIKSHETGIFVDRKTLDKSKCIKVSKICGALLGNILRRGKMMLSANTVAKPS